MSDFTDEDVTAVDSVLGMWGIRKQREDIAANVLAAVLPAYAKRVRAEALREAAEDYWRQLCPDYGFVAAWLRARADGEGGNDE